ncbi:MAG: hypothetical protein K2K82_01950 [Muribaculaceae bacterium]|nr:hypothetical protein [Muribaculaceae bacterium]
MKKLLLITAIAAAAFAPTPVAGATKVLNCTQKSADAVTSLTDGAYYVIYDGHSDGTSRHAFRYMAADGHITGDHTSDIASLTTVPSSYVWQAVADGDNWKFKNLGINGYLPASANNQNNLILTTQGNACAFEVIAQDASGQFKIRKPDTNIYWDGNGDDDSYNMVFWEAENGGHPYYFYEYDVENAILTTGDKVLLRSVEPTGATPRATTGFFVSMNLEGRTGTTEQTQNPYVSTLGSELYVTTSQTSPNEVQFSLNDADGNTIIASGWNAKANTKDSFYWTLVDSDEEFDTQNPVVMLYQNQAQIGFLGNQPANANDAIRDVLYCNNAANSIANTALYWEIVPADNAVDLTLTFKLTTDGDDIMTVNTASEIGMAFPYYAGFTCQNTNNVSKTNLTATYVLNNYVPMQIYNERADSYVHIKDEKLFETSDANDESTNFWMVEVNKEEGSMLLYNPSAKKFVGNVSGNANVPLVDLLTAQIYYTGKYDGTTRTINPGTTYEEDVYFPVYADWIGTVKAEENDGAALFFNDHAGTPRYVCAYRRFDDGSKWIIVTDKENFKANWAMRQDLIAAKAAYLAALEKVGIDPDATLVKFAEEFVFDGDVNLPLSDTTKKNYQDLLKAVDDAAGLWPAKLMESTELYTIQSVDDIRGALIYDPASGHMTTTVNAPATLDSTNDNHLWGFVKVDGKFYLYNRGAEKFAAAYIYHEGSSNTGAVYAWDLSEVPTAIELSSEAFGNAEALNNNKLIIKGGKAGADNPAGMMIINGDKTNIPCSLGNNDATDGTGFIFTAIRSTEQDDVMKGKVADGFAMVNDKIETICMPLEDGEYEAETHGKQVGHFTEEAVAALESSKTAAQALDDKQAAMYVALEAARAFKTNESNYRVVEDGNVYTISDSEGNIHFTDGTSHLSAETLPAGADAKLVNWVATVADGKVSFSHSHEGAEEAAPASMYYANTNVVNFAVNDATEFTVKRTAVPGKVTLNDDASKTYVITHVSADANEATTNIAEIGATADKADAVYDLQGRRLAAPVKGFNIINGHKVIVK